MTAASTTVETRGNRPLIVETEPERLARLRRLLMGSTSLERAWGELSTAHTRGRAAAATVEALVYGLRDGIEKLNHDRLRRLSELNEEQLRAVCERLQNFKPHIAPAWSPEEVEALAVIWSDLRHEAQSEHE